MINKSRFYYIIIFLLVVIRFFHLGNEIDAPHDWRQCDTAYYIYDFYKSGIDLTHPSVCWMGNQDEVILEFPLPEALVAIGYHIFGYSHFVARIFFLVVFLLSAYYLFKIIKRLYSKSTAQLTLLFYCSSPLGLFYSRALHIDFSALLCSFIMFYFFIIGVEKRRSRFLLISAIACTLGFLIKVPYLYIMVLPMVYFAYSQSAIVWTAKRSIIFLIPCITYIWWQLHVFNINSASPDWDFILHYRKMIPSKFWYFGDMTQRLSLYHWKILAERGVMEVVGLGAIIFCVFSFFKIVSSKYRVLLFWIGGLTIYILTFFNLNFVHNYYQIPLIGPAAVLSAIGFQQFKAKGNFLKTSLLIIAIFGNVVFSEYKYYNINYEYEEISTVINNNTPDDKLIIVTNNNMDCRNPNILYRAERKGWSIEEDAVNINVLETLRNEGAHTWVYISEKPELPILYNSLRLIYKQPLTTSSKYLYIYEWKQ